MHFRSTSMKFKMRESSSSLFLQFFLVLISDEFRFLFWRRVKQLLLLMLLLLLVFDVEQISRNYPHFDWI